MNKEFIDALVAKGYPLYLAEMFGKMLQDLQGRADELSKLTGMNFSINIG